ncbi:hypothetical protein KM043_006762 [Ampulex compressa]|nr:hypothetical protein KM043_006762 [Ampulex compressa]
MCSFHITFGFKEASCGVRAGMHKIRDGTTKESPFESSRSEDDKGSKSKNAETREPAENTRPKAAQTKHPRLLSGILLSQGILVIRINIAAACKGRSRVRGSDSSRSLEERTRPVASVGARKRKSRALASFRGKDEGHDVLFPRSGPVARCTSLDTAKAVTYIEIQINSSPSATSAQPSMPIAKLDPALAKVSLEQCTFHFGSVEDPSDRSTLRYRPAIMSDRPQALRGNDTHFLASADL